MGSSGSALLHRRGAQLYLAGLALLSLAAALLPLADHLGYESAELVALFAGAFGAAPGIAAARDEPRSAARALGRALGFGLLALAVPVAILLLNGVRRPACDPLGGLVLYAAIAVPSALLSAALGVACGFLVPRRAPLAVAAVFVASLAVALAPVVRGPQVFVFAHLGGFYPGPLYDEAIAATPALWIFRGATLLYAAACCGLALAAGPPRPRLRGFALFGLAGAGALLLSLQAERFHWKASAAQVERELGGRLETEHLVLHFPREKTQAERRLLAIDAETSWAAVRDFAALSGPARKIDVYLHRSAAEKRTLLGAAETSFTKPWLRQIHTNDAPAPHPILRHELAHAVAADLARGPWKVPGRLFGLVPDMALTEGFAVAADWPAGELTVHEETHAERVLGLEPPLERLFRPGLFYAESGARAYTTAGSFVRWLAQSRGRELVRDVYAGQRPLGDLAELAREHGAFLDAQPLAPAAVALVQQRFSAPAIVRKRCAHEVAELQREALTAAGRGDPARAGELWERCSALEPDDPALLLQLARAQALAGERAAAGATRDRTLAHAKLSQPLRAQVLTDAGDAAWEAGDLAAAQARYDQAALLPQPEAARRALLLRRRALGDAPSWPALRPLLARGDSGPAVWLALRDLDLARRGDGTFAYLLAKQLQNHGAWPECLAYAREALRRGLPGPLFLEEALRMQGIAAWHAGDLAQARLAFTALGTDAPPGRALEAQRWLDRLR